MLIFGCMKLLELHAHLFTSQESISDINAEWLWKKKISTFLSKKRNNSSYIRLTGSLNYIYWNEKRKMLFIEIFLWICRQLCYFIHINVLVSSNLIWFDLLAILKYQMPNAKYFLKFFMDFCFVLLVFMMSFICTWKWIEIFNEKKITRNVDNH